MSLLLQGQESTPAHCDLIDTVIYNVTKQVTTFKVYPLKAFLNWNFAN